MSSSSSNTFLLSAADASWGRRECNTVLINGAATTLDGKYFEVDVPTLADFGISKAYYVWFDLDASSVDPAPAGRTAIEVDVITGDLASDVATKLSAALELEADFRSKIDDADSTGATAIMEAEFKGAALAVAVDVDTLATITQRVSGAGGDLGKTSGGIEVTMETTKVDILSDQTGALKLDSVLTGQSVEAAMSLLEMTQERWRTLVSTVTGDSFTPGGGTELIGYGESRLYASLLDLGGELVLHPTRLPASDRSKNITLWKSSPEPASINFSGEEPQVMEVAFVGLADPSVVEAIRIMAFGDNEQDVRV